MLLRHASESLIFIELSERRVEFSRSPVEGDLTAFTLPRVNANEIKNVILHEPVAVLPLQG